MNTFSTNLSIFSALMRRNYKIISEDIWGTLLDKLILILTYVIVFGHFFPLLGMPQEYVAPVFVGNLLLLFMSVGSSQSLTILFDLKYQRYLNYLLILPLPKRWLFASYVVDFMTQLLLTTLPLFFFGIVLLGALFPMHQVNWYTFSLVYLLSTLFLSFFLITTSFWYGYTWYMANIWPRRIGPMLTLTCVFVTWKQVYNFSHPIGLIFLANPLTYITEGLRTTLLGAQPYLPITSILVGLTISIVLATLWFVASIKRRLDPV